MKTTDNIFKSLPVGATFRFDSEKHFPRSGMKTGLCRKTSARCYQYVIDGMKCRVGSINTGIFEANQ